MNFRPFVIYVSKEFHGIKNIYFRKHGKNFSRFRWTYFTTFVSSPIVHVRLLGKVTKPNYKD